MEHVTRYTSHVTHHTSHVTCHTHHTRHTRHTTSRDIPLLEHFCTFVSSFYPSLHIVVNNACQTVRLKTKTLNPKP